MERLAVLVQKMDADLGPDSAILDFLLDELLHPSLQVVRKILHDGKNFLNGCSLDYLFDKVIVWLIVIRINMDFGDPTEEIVNVTEDVLIRAHQEEAQVV